jgi:hypothetical protein
MTNETQHYYWIAINGSSCALSITPMRNATTIPVAQQMFGFPTLEEARKAQRICLTAPITEGEAFMERLRPDVKSGRIIYKGPANPEPPTKGQTAWIGDTDHAREQEFADATRRAYADTKDPSA